MSGRRLTRPKRAQLEALIRETGGNMTRLARALDCSRTTAYCWVYQLDLADVVGIQFPEIPTKREAHVVKSAGAPAGDVRVPVTVKLPESLWKRVRIRAIDEDRRASAIVEEAVRRYLAALAGGPDASA